MPSRPRGALSPTPRPSPEGTVCTPGANSPSTPEQHRLRPPRRWVGVGGCCTSSTLCSSSAPTSPSSPGGSFRQATSPLSLESGQRSSQKRMILGARADRKGVVANYAHQPHPEACTFPSRNRSEKAFSTPLEDGSDVMMRHHIKQ